MLEERTPIDISGIPDLVRIVQDVRATNRPRVLRQDGEDVAVVMPIARKRVRRPSSADYEAALATAGGWKDLVDGESLKEQLDAERGSARAPGSL